MSYLIGICGSGGGSGGPNGLYDLLEQKYMNVIMYNTIPRNLTKNTSNIIKIINDILEQDNDASFIIMGYSMGGTIAINVGLYFEEKKIINKILLFSTQTKGFNNINDLSCEIIFFHPKNDEIIPIDCVRKYMKLYKNKKRFFAINKGYHNWYDINMTNILSILENIF